MPNFFFFFFFDAQYFSDVEGIAFTWQQSEASIAIKTLSGEVEDPCREAIACT